MLMTQRTLANTQPELLKQWHPNRNCGLSPETLPPATHRKVWWRCERGHEWQAQVNARARGTGCPICTNRRIAVGENDLGTTHPEIAAQWHPERNAPLLPQMVFAGSSKKIWWCCDNGHEYQATVQSRTTGRNGCPICAGKQVIQGENDLAMEFPEIAAQWHPTKNGTLQPEQVTPFSNRRVWWRCEKGHEYRSVIADRVMRMTDCPYCTGRKVLAGFNDLATLEPMTAAQWHPTLNAPLTAEMVTVGSHRKVWWQCSLGHVWKAVVYSRTGEKKCGCPVCAGKVKKPRVGYDPL